MAQKPNQRSSGNWVQHALRRTGWQPQRQVIAVGTLGVFIALILGGLYLSQVSQEASRGRDMRKLINERDELERSNEELRVQIAEYKSLPRLQARARELNFVDATTADMEWLVVNGYTPYRQETVITQKPETDSEVPEYSETFGGWLSQTWDTLRSQFAGFNSQSQGG
ncbi:MAG TPA: hypothetical protein VHL11_06760 [Phototrophicaceae bacterium]|jgi:hypothetical protein|nr:hypothetical protein [Phototrophicaceae bacterium]